MISPPSDRDCKKLKELWAETHSPRRLGPHAEGPCSRDPARNDQAAAITVYGPGVALGLHVCLHTHKLQEEGVDRQVKY